MKKIISIALAVMMIAIAVCSLASCGNNNTAKTVSVVDIELTSEEYAYAVQKGNTELLNSLNEFLATIKSNGTFDTIINKYFGDGTPSAVTSAATMKTDGSQLIVATNAAFEPFEYMNGENYYGVDMEIMAAFAESLGRELYIYNMEFDAVCLSVSSAGGTYEAEDGTQQTVTGGVCDVAAAGLTVTDTRKEILDFSTSYYNAAQVLIVSSDNTEFASCKTAADVEAILKTKTADYKVGVQNGTTGYYYCTSDADWGFDTNAYKFTTVGYANGALAVQNILNGNVDAVVIDQGPAKAITSRTNEAN